MPMSRYELRNEYSLADPDLYRAADKDDPEALLEGVAMAGLVGLLRQLGDLAEFAAEIFHDLHEEVMETAARGHGFMIRVKQLEAEIPSIEKAFLIQTDHSPFFYNAGLDWHPKLRMDQNLVTKGDLPQFVMDSYEECRGPPRLFLLDKFDVAGAGACLKRYTDPSFFNVETSAMTNVDVDREKKIRKAKKRGPLWRNEETPEVLPTSHAKLHQLVMEEPVENGVSIPARRAKLKRRLRFSPFDSKTGGSYMEKLLKTSSPGQQTLREITVSSSSQMSHNESDLEVLEPRSVSPPGECVWTKKGIPPDRDEIMQNPLIYETNDVSADDKIIEVPSYLNTVTDDIPSTFDEEICEKEIPVDEEIKTEGFLTSHQSDEVASDIGNYVDAPSTIESGMDTDPELRVKNDFTSSSIHSQQLVSVENEHLHSLSSDSQSTGDFTTSDDGNSSSKKESSDFPRISAENSPSQNTFAEGLPSADVPEIALVGASIYQKTADEFPGCQLPKQCIFDNSCIGKDAVTNKQPDFEPTPNLCATESIPIFPHDDDSGVVRKGMLREPKSDETASTLDGEEKKINLIMDFPCSPSVSDSNSQSGNDSSSSSSEEHLVDEPNRENATCMSIVSDIDNVEMIPIENPLPCKLDDDVPKLRNVPSDYTDTVHNGDNITLKPSEGVKLINNLENEDSNVVSDAPNHTPCIMEASLGKELAGISLTIAETVDAEDRYSDSFIDNQIGSERLISSPIENSPDCLEAGLDTRDRDFIPEEETTIINETPELGNPKSCEVVGLQETEITDNVTPNDLVAQGSSCCTQESLENPTALDIVTKDEIDSCKDVIGQDITKGSSYEVHELLGEADFMTDQSQETGVMPCFVSPVSVNAIRENVNVPVNLDNLFEDHISCFDGSGLDELENEKKSLSESHQESSLVEKVDVEEASTSHLHPINNDHPKLEVSRTVSYPDLDCVVDATQVQSPLELSDLDTGNESFQQSGIVNQVSDATTFLPTDRDTKETTLEKNELLPDQIDQELRDSCERSSELSSPLPINQQQILDIDDHKGDEISASPLSLINCPPSVSALPELYNYDVYISAYPKDSLGFIFPQSNFFSDTNQINLDELPPLPPLPPVQWIMGKHQNASSMTEEEIVKHEELFPQEFFPSTALDGDISSSLEEMNYSLSRGFPEAKSKEEKTAQSSSSSEAISTHETIDLPSNIENEQQQLVIPTPESEITIPVEENGAANESRIMKLPRPRNPLIDSVAALDKGKLRKVVDRVTPQTQEVDERDSLLEQIRARSFNLKPALTSRPRTQGPQTNLKVAAILEKANAIRQAFAGSDEDDEDNWSDS